MLIYNSMILWIAICGMFYYLAEQRKIKLNDCEIQTKVPTLYGIITYIYIIFWVGIRSGVADTAVYITMFKSYSTDLSLIPRYWNISENKSPGFDTLNIIFKHFVSDNYHIWLLTIAVLTGIPIMLKLREKSTHFFYSSYLFMTSILFFWMLNGMRQFLVVSIMFFASDWIEEKKTIRFIVLVLLMSTIHFTVLVMIPMYFIAIERPFGKKVILFMLLLLASIVFLNPFISSMENLMVETAYSGFSQQFVQDDGVNPIRVMVMCVTPILAFLGRRNTEIKNNTYINICVNMSVICAGIYFLGIFTSGILVGRLPVYFEIYNLVLLPHLMKECFTKRSVKIVFVICTICYFYYYWMQMNSSYYVSDITGVLQGWGV